MNGPREPGRTGAALDEAELLRRFPRHRPRLLTAAARLVGTAEAEDVVQECLLRALAGAAAFRGEAALGTWLHRIAINIAHDRLRRRTVEPEADAGAGADERVDPEPGPAEGLERKQMNGCVQAVLADLPGHYRDALYRADVLEQTAAEIAGESGISVGNAKIRLHRARQALKAALDEKCSFYRRDGGVLCCTPKEPSAETARVSFSPSASSKGRTDPVPHTEPDHAG